jgi:hypothetical protein
MSKKDTVSVKASQDGKSVGLTITQSDGKVAAAKLAAEKIGTLVLALLAAGVDCAGRGGPVAAPPAQGSSPQRLPYVKAKGVALVESDTPDVIGIVFAIGSTELNLGLPRAALKPLGTAILALTADQKRPQ